MEKVRATHGPRRMLFSLALVALGLALGTAPVLAADDGLDTVRAATAEFKDVKVATAGGYGILKGTPLEKCIDEPGSGAMGFHYVNGDLVGDTVLDATKPEALLYLPDARGRLQLLGVEYVVFAEAWDAENSEPPMLLGNHFHLISAPNRYELPSFYQLHAWAWKANPAGAFESFNPAVKCPLPDTSLVTAPPLPGPAPVVPLLALVCGIVAARRIRIGTRRT